MIYVQHPNIIDLYEYYKHPQFYHLILQNTFLKFYYLQYGNHINRQNYKKKKRREVNYPYSPCTHTTIINILIYFLPVIFPGHTWCNYNCNVHNTVDLDFSFSFFSVAVIDFYTNSNLFNKNSKKTKSIRTKSCLIWFYLINRERRRVPRIDSWFIDVNNCYPDFRAHMSNDTTCRSSNIARTNATNLLNFKHDWTRRKVVRLVYYWKQNLRKSHCTFITHLIKTVKVTDTWK